MYAIYIRFMSRWVKVADFFDDRDNAWWTVAKWRQDNRCGTDKAFAVYSKEEWEKADNYDLSRSNASDE